MADVEILICCENRLLDLIQILISKQLISELCIPDGDLQYLLPAGRRVVRKLAGFGVIYKKLYSMFESEDNGILRYGKSFMKPFIPGEPSCFNSCGKEPAGAPERQRSACKPVKAGLWPDFPDLERSPRSTGIPVKVFRFPVPFPSLAFFVFLPGVPHAYLHYVN